MSGGLDGERRARAALTRLVDPGDAELGELIATLGPEEITDRTQRGDPPGSPRLAGRLAARMGALDVDRDLRAATAVGGRFVMPGDDEWPRAVDDLGATAPVALWLRGAGSLGSLSRRAVAIVGSRAMSEYGQHVATGLGGDLGERGWTIVSGGAYGIDAAAHRGALAVGATTVAVLACGIDVTYPAGHVGLFDEIAADGVLVSELPPGCAPHSGRFLTRNRIIAALAAGTVVVESAIRSGARRTAYDTLALGRPLMVVPGPVTSETSAGCHALLRDCPEAVLVTRAAEVLELVGRIGADLAPELRSPVRARDRLDPDTGRVLDALPVRRGQGPARIAATAGLPLPTVLPALALLGALGHAEETFDGWRLRRTARPSGA